MNLELILKAVQDARAFIAQLGVNTDGLIAVGAVAGLLLIFSLREVLTWYLRVGALRDDVRALRGEIGELKALLKQSPPLIVEHEMVATGDEDESKKKVEKSAKNFPLSH